MLFCTKVEGYGENLLQNISDFMFLCSTSCHPCWLIYMYMYQTLFYYYFFVQNHHSCPPFNKVTPFKGHLSYEATFRCNIIVK